MSAATQRWKAAEKQLAEILKEHGIDAERVSRGSNYAISDHDVKVKGFPEFKLDSKYSLKQWRSSTLLEIVREKYCSEKNDKPIIFLKSYKERSGKIVIDADFFAELLRCWIDNKDKKD